MSISIGLCVSLSVCLHIFKTNTIQYNIILIRKLSGRNFDTGGQTPLNFLCMLTVPMTWSSSSSIAICYVLLFCEWCHFFHIIGPDAACCYRSSIVQGLMPLLYGVDCIPTRRQVTSPTKKSTGQWVNSLTAKSTLPKSSQTLNAISADNCHRFIFSYANSMCDACNVDTCKSLCLSFKCMHKWWNACFT